MHDHWLIAIALAVSATGIIVLLVALTLLTPAEHTIQATAALPDGHPTRIRGAIERVTQRGPVTVVTVSQPSTIDAIIFANETLNITKGECVIIAGKKAQYNGEPQLTAHKIQRCDPNNL